MKIEVINKWAGLVKVALEIVVLGFLIFAFRTCSQEVKMQKRDAAITEIYKIKDRQFLESQTRLRYIASESTSDSIRNCEIIKWFYESKDCDRGKIEFLSDLNYLFNTYENIGSFYDNGLIDKKILEGTVCEELQQFDSIYQKLQPIYFPDKPLPDSNYLNLLNKCDQ